MIEEAESDLMKVIEGIDLRVGNLNTPEEDLLANIRYSIRLGYPQVKPQGVQLDRVCLVGGGPSLEATFPELRDLYFGGAKVVTVNGAYTWCIERNIRPAAQVILDARSFNARFVDPVIPQCRYLLASQCHSDTWAAVAGREDVWIWHAIGPENVLRAELDAFYLGAWTGIPGGVTVMMRALTLLRTIGYLRYDMFGLDSCWMGDRHHAYPQKENQEERILVRAHPSEHLEAARTFWCAPWHLKQLEDVLQTIRLNGQHFKLNVHGDGLVAYALRASADFAWTVSGAAALLGPRSEGE